MTDLRKAAEQALEFCEDIGGLGGPYPYVDGTAIVGDSRKVLQALRQALAQPTWRCPLKKPDCNENCGSYGCGN